MKRTASTSSVPSLIIETPELLYLQVPLAAIRTTIASSAPFTLLTTSVHLELSLCPLGGVSVTQKSFNVDGSTDTQVFWIGTAEQRERSRLHEQLRTHGGTNVPSSPASMDYLPEGVAWIGQSTVAISCSKGWDTLEKLRSTTPLMQVHDSIVFQYRTSQEHTALREAKAALSEIVVPYPDPMELKWSLKTSRSSWGACTKAEWPSSSR